MHPAAIPSFLRDRSALLAAWGKALRSAQLERQLRPVVEEVLEAQEPFHGGPALAHAARRDLRAAVRALDALGAVADTARRAAARRGALGTMDPWEALRRRVDAATAAAARIATRRAGPRRVAEEQLRERLAAAEREAGERLRSAQDDVARLTGEVLRAQNEERRRLARELHDGPAQHVVAAGLTLARLDNATATAERARLVADAAALCREAAQQLRTLAYVLHPPSLDRGLVAAVQSCADGFAARSGVRTTFRHSSTQGLPRPIELALFRIVQEALSNVQRHASAHRVEIVLGRSDGQVALVVRDDGRGFDGGTSIGIGIAGMHERVRLLGGTFEARGVRGRTEIRATLPIEVHVPIHER